MLPVTFSMMRCLLRPLPSSETFTLFLTLFLRLATSRTLTSACSRAAAISFKQASNTASSMTGAAEREARACVTLCPSSASTIPGRAWSGAGLGAGDH